MALRPSTALDFGPPALVDASLSERVRGLVGSEILRIAGEIREMVAAGRPVCNLTVGDFDPRLFPIPAGLLERTQAALRPGRQLPALGWVLALRKAVARTWARARRGLASGIGPDRQRGAPDPVRRLPLRPRPGETVVYSVPSWNNNHYA